MDQVHNPFILFAFASFVEIYHEHAYGTLQNPFFLFHSKSLAMSLIVAGEFFPSFVLFMHLLLPSVIILHLAVKRLFLRVAT